MAYSIITVVGNGTSQYPINFTLGFNSRTEVKCRVDNEVDGLGDPVYRALTWINDGLVEVAGGPFDNTRTLVFSRTVDKTELIHDYGNGEEIEESNLDESNRQNLMAIHEVLDGRFESPLAQDLDMGGFKIVNMANGVSDDDAASIEQINAVLDNAANITIVATNIANVNTVAGSISNVNTVAGAITNVNTVATNIANVNTVVTNIANVNTVATNIANVDTVAGIASDGDITAVAGITTNGLATRTATNTWTTRTLTGTTGQVTVTNGDGISGNPTLALPSSVKFGTTHTLDPSASSCGILGGFNGNIDSLCVYTVLAGGSNNAATNAYYGFIGAGNGNSISGTGAFATGFSNTSTGEYNIAFGKYANATKKHSITQGGGRFSATGDAQTTVSVVRQQTTNGTLTAMLNDASQRLNIASDTTWAFEALIVGRRTDADNESAAYQLLGCIDNNAGTVALVGSVTKNVIAEDNAAWDVSATADDTNNALIINVTGEAAKTINWVARVTLTEVTG